MTTDTHAPAGAPLVTTGSFVSIPCPECGGAPCCRSHRHGLTEKLLSALYVYPFRCQLCGHRFFSLQWGTRYHRVRVDQQETDRREYHRHPARIPAMLSGPLGEFLGTTTDMSICGCILTAAGPFREQSRWRIRIQLPAEPHPVTIDDAVVRAVRNQQIRLEFLWAAPAEKERLSRFIETIGKQSVPGFTGRPARPVPSSSFVSPMMRTGSSSPLQ